MNDVNKLLKSLSCINCASGDEYDLYKFIVNYCSEFSKVERDELNNIYITPFENRGKKKILLEAHGDEIGFLIQSINHNGTLNFVNVGGVRKNTYAGSNVFVKRNDGSFTRGTIVPVSANDEIIQSKDYNSLFVIDIGAVSCNDAIDNFGIEIGNFVTPIPFFYHDTSNGIYWGKGFDDRIGCAALIKTIEILEKDQINYIAIISAQEEVGSRGIRYAIKRIHKQIKRAICFEGALANDNYFNTEKCLTALKQGPILRTMDNSMICNTKFLKKVMAIAKREVIPYQCSVKNSGGTDASVIYNEFGIPSIVLGIPVRHIHTFSCIASDIDLINSIKLANAVVKEFSREEL